MTKVLNCLWVMEDEYIFFLRTATLTPEIVEVIIAVMVLELDLGHKRTDTLYLTIMVFIICVLMVEVKRGLKKPATLPLSIVEQELILKGYVNIGIIPYTLPRASQEVMVDFRSLISFLSCK